MPSNGALLKGFIVRNYVNWFDEGMRQLAHWLREKRVEYTEDILEGLENTSKAFIGLCAGKNHGKQPVKVS